MTDWHDAGPADLAPGALRCVDVGGERYLIARDAGGGWHAVAALCSHALQPMEKGRVRGRALLCPHHGARFDLASGKALGPPAWTGIAVYPLRLVGDRVEIGLQ
jgi:3-phenylpropionate/trans-cinnamate dioxygenase ferredoxin component